MNSCFWEGGTKCMSITRSRSCFKIECYFKTAAWSTGTTVVIYRTSNMDPHHELHCALCGVNGLGIGFPLVAASWYVKESVRQSGAVVTPPVSISSYPLRLRRVTKPKRLGQFRWVCLSNKPQVKALRLQVSSKYVTHTRPPLRNPEC